LPLLAISLATSLIRVGETSAAAEQRTDVAQLIDQLVDVAEIGFGYAGLSGGSEFLADARPATLGPLVIGSPQPKRSPVLEAIVRQGAAAVPALLKHLDDQRPAKIPPIKGMMWMAVGSEYDFNRRTRPSAPAGVNQEWNPDSTVKSHTISVGDLCFVALGQIANRHFSATRYQPSGGTVINSPPDSPALRQAARADFADFTPAKHRAMLLADFAAPDSNYRREGAYRRLVFYYPDAAEQAVLQQLAVPTFDAHLVSRFVFDKLYDQKDPARRKQSLDEFVKQHGRPYDDGVLLKLFEDLRKQEQTERGDSGPIRWTKYDARSLLVALFNYPQTVKSEHVPDVESWSIDDQRSFIEDLDRGESPRIDEAVYQIFTKDAEKDESLALVTMDYLVGRGHDEEIRDFCQRQLPQADEKMARALEKILEKLQKPSGENSESRRLQLRGIGPCRTLVFW
jgi:hypothetical protein